MGSQFDTYMDAVKAAIKSGIQPIKGFLDVFSNPVVSFFVVVTIFAGMLVYCILRYKDDAKKEIKKTRTLAICAMMMAINIILSYYVINFSAYLRVGFGFVTQPVVTMLFGPLIGCMTGMIQDVLSFVLKPTGGYIPTYTVCVGISGMIYGIMLYNKPITITRVFAAKLIITLVSNVVLNTIALAPTVGSGFVGIFPARLVKNLIMLPIQTIVVYFILKYIVSAHKKGA